MEQSITNDGDPLPQYPSVEHERESQTLKRHCPFIGLDQDAKTVMAYPTMLNRCHRFQPAQSVRLDYQGTHCLTFAHRHCPVLLESSVTTLPPEISATSAKRRSVFVMLGIASIFILLTGAFLLFGGWQWTSANDWFFDPGSAQPQQEIINTPGVLQANPKQSTPTATEGSSLFVPLVGNPPRIVETTATLAPFTSTSTPQNTKSLEPTPTSTSKYCNHPVGWVVYTVRSGDTLASISQATGATVAELRDANCLETSLSIWVGQELYVPNRISNFPSPFPTSTLQPTRTNTSIALPTDTPIPTDTSTPLPTDTPISTLTSTPLATDRPRSTNTALPLPTDTSMPTDTSTPLPTDTPEPTDTYTPLPTDTPIPTHTPPPMSTDTFTPLPTDTPIPTDIP